jgi:hypothetical protein
MGAEHTTADWDALMDLLSSLTAISQALGIAKELKEIDRGINEAEFKLKVAELMSALADAKVSLADAQSEVAALKEKLTELEEGPRCPVCKAGRLLIDRVEHWEDRSWETHFCKCDNSACSYFNKRIFNSDRLRYRE